MFPEWNNDKQSRELYDHDNNPKEITNPADNPATAAELSAKLRKAVKTTFPADGKTLEIREIMWSRNLTNP